MAAAASISRPLVGRENKSVADRHPSFPEIKMASAEVEMKKRQVCRISSFRENCSSSFEAGIEPMRKPSGDWLELSLALIG